MSWLIKIRKPGLETVIDPVRPRAPLAASSPPHGPDALPLAGLQQELSQPCLYSGPQWGRGSVLTACPRLTGLTGKSVSLGAGTLSLANLCDGDAVGSWAGPLPSLGFSFLRTDEL